MEDRPWCEWFNNNDLNHKPHPEEMRSLRIVDLVEINIHSVTHFNPI
jgi:hypothetical protein